MNKKLRKAVASIAAAALCAVSAMSTTINADAVKDNSSLIYTYRHPYAIRSSGVSIKKISLTYKVKNKYCSNTPKLCVTGNGSFIGGGSGAGGYDIWSGSWTPNTPVNGLGIVFTVSTFASATDFSAQNGSYVANMTFSGSAPKNYVSNQFLDPYLVGDINNDGKIDNADKETFEHAKNPASGYSTVIGRGGRDISYVKVKLYNANGKAVKDANIQYYKFDIDNNGIINNNDLTALTNYLGNHKHFAS